VASDGNIRAISRALAVLQVVNHHRSLSMMAIARHADLPYPTAFRIVETLIESGMIERESTRKHYRPTRLVTTLSVGFQEEDTLAEVSRRHITALTRELRWPISVCTRVGMTMMLRESTHAIAPFTLNVYHPGYTLPLLDSSSGKAYIAFSDETEQEAVLDHVRRTNAANAPRLVPRLQAVLCDIREKGYSIQDRLKHTANPGKTSAISVPIMGRKNCEGTVTLAFFCSTMTLPDAIDRFVPSIRATAASIAKDLAETRITH
jgi:IclR family mhp operon transcriptional activator